MQTDKEKADARSQLQLYVSRAAGFEENIVFSTKIDHRNIILAVYAYYCGLLNLGIVDSATELKMSTIRFHRLRINCHKVLKRYSSEDTKFIPKFYKLLSTRVSEQLQRPEELLYYPSIRKELTPYDKKHFTELSSLGVPLSVKYKTPHGYVNLRGEIILWP